jgi:hypothetical protein
MCQTCYNALGSPRLDNEDVRRMAAAAADLRSNRVNELIQEWNIEDVHLDGCLAWAHLPEREWIWITSMRRLSLAERGSVLALIAGYWRT